jgi:asparagine synthase (glutamine-hydrolysing)
MCGIAGILTNRSDLDLHAIACKMRTCLRHRGPDDEGIEELPLAGGYRLCLIHTRLSILDLSSAGHQPMCDPESGSWIVYNGEIYNHQQIRRGMQDVAFRSTSDTETLLKAWARHGSKTLDSLRGMFALALYDGSRKELWLARDRLGIKPLYVAQVEPGTIVFASEVRTILASGFVARRLDPDAIQSYLAFGAVAAPWTMVEGIDSLMPAEALRIDLASPGGALETQRSRYWRVPFESNSAKISYREAVEQLRPVLTEALSLHMLSDVPVGIFLSGGIDSSSLVAALSHAGHKLHTFSVLFGEQEFDESIYARRIAAKFGTDHTELHLEPSHILSGLEDAVSSYDQPSIDGINTFFISQAVRQAGVKVAMSGLGGDELFAGYTSFRLASLLDRPLYRQLAAAARPVLSQVAPGTMRATKLGAILAAKGSRLETYAVFRQVMMSGRRDDLMADASYDGLTPMAESLSRELREAVSQLDAVNAYSLMELSLYMANMLLRDADQMSMAHSIEVRVPLLDHVLVEAVARLPGSLKLSGLHPASKKRLLIDALPVRLPQQVLNRRKMGFVFPWEHWLRRELRTAVACVFADFGALEAVGVLPQAAEELWNDYLAHRPGIRYTDILCLVNLMTWVRQHNLSLN